MNESENTRKMIVKDALKKRGWTDTMIKKHYPTPDEFRDNSHYRGAYPMCLYRLENVEAIEQTPQFQADRDRAEKRRGSAMKAVQTKENALLKRFERVKANIPKMAPEDLCKAACKHYNQSQNDRAMNFGRFDCAGNFADPKTSPQNFLDRIMVNYVRHQMTEYDCLLDSMYGKVGKNKAYLLIRSQILDAIAAAYPHLNDECERQKAAPDFTPQPVENAA